LGEALELQTISGQGGEKVGGCAAHFFSPVLINNCPSEQSEESIKLIIFPK
jgi:hypothetical protein